MAYQDRTLPNTGLALDPIAAPTGFAKNGLPLGVQLVGRPGDEATLIGQKTGKCVGYALKSKKCRICSAAKAKNVTPRTCETSMQTNENLNTLAIEMHVLRLGVCKEGQEKQNQDQRILHRVRNKG